MEACKLKNISFTYPSRESKALSNVSFTVDKGEGLIVVGSSAGGKSTLLKLMKKELAPHGILDGEIIINGSVGYVSQHFDESFVTHTVRSELAFSPSNAGLSAEETELLVAEAAAYFNLDSKLDCEISALSGGEKQILSLACVMIMKPDILLLDEPSSQLDPVSSAALFDVIRTMRRDFGTTIIMAEHNLDSVFDISDKILLLESGKVCVYDSRDAAAKWMLDNNSPMAEMLPAALLSKNANEAREISSDIALTAKNLYFAYEKGSDILCGLDLKLYKNNINVIVGTNGSGKSTLLKVLCGVKKAYRGRIKTDCTVSMLPQNVYDLFSYDTCGEEIEFGKTTDFFGISDIKDYHPYDISGGQAQRLALAKVLETGADIILLDEPTNGLDCVLKEKLGNLLRALCDDGKTIVIVTHDLDFAGRFADIASFLSCGKIIATMPKKEFFSRLKFYTTKRSRYTNGEMI